jgi:hypothetical protein
MVAVSRDAGSDHDRLGHDPAADPGLAVGRVEEDAGDRFLIEWAGASGGEREPRLDRAPNEWVAARRRDERRPQLVPSSPVTIYLLGRGPQSRPV